jgi:uncharacterized membrane-anchored protein YitT (DUF2179 family)
MILGLSINLLSWQYKLVSGGLPGYGLAINYVTGFPVGMFLLIINTVILALSFVIAGKTAGFRGVYGYAFLSIFIDLSRSLLNLKQIALADLPSSILLTTLQGIIAPIGIAIVMANGYTFGSYSSMVPIINKFLKISAPKFFFVMDFILTIITLFFFGVKVAGLLLLNAAVFFIVFKYALSLTNKVSASRAH